MSCINKQSNQSTAGPFSVVNMHFAGVGVMDLVWFRGLGNHAAKMHALHTSARGRAILDLVHAYEQRKLAAAMPLRA